MIGCPACGKETPEGLAHCAHCGHILGGSPAGAQGPSPAGWLRRGPAFLVDLALVGLAWGVLSNLIAFPVPMLFSVLGSALTFWLYFLLVEVPGNRAASPGKRLFGIELLDRQTHRKPPAREIAIRAALLAAMISIPWERLLSLLPEQTPQAVVISLASLVFGILFYNGLLALFGPDRAMLQDIWTATAVVHGNRGKSGASPGLSAEDALARRVLWPKPGLAVLTTLLVFAGYLAVAAIQAEVISLGEKLASPIGRSPEAALETAMATDLGLRSSVEIVEYYENFETRRLEITVWLPFVSYNKENADRVVEWLATEMPVQPGYYESGTLTIETGITGPIEFSIGSDVELNMP